MLDISVWKKAFCESENCIITQQSHFNSIRLASLENTLVIFFKYLVLRNILNYINVSINQSIPVDVSDGILLWDIRGLVIDHDVCQLLFNGYLPGQETGELGNCPDFPYSQCHRHYYYCIHLLKSLVLRDPGNPRQMSAQLTGERIHSLTI